MLLAPCSVPEVVFSVLLLVEQLSIHKSISCCLAMPLAVPFDDQ